MYNIIYLIKKEEPKDAYENMCKYISEDGNYEFWEDPEWYEYKEKYGYSFSPKLAEMVSSYGKDLKGKEDYWTMDEVSDTLTKLSIKLPSNIKLCDFMVAVNKEKKEHLGGSVLKTPEDVFKYTYEDVLGYEYDGQLFDKFLNKAMRMGECVDWDDLM